MSCCILRFAVFVLALLHVFKLREQESTTFCRDNLRTSIIQTIGDRNWQIVRRWFFWHRFNDPHTSNVHADAPSDVETFHS